MADNVFILGAGFSFDAGIPLMGTFVQTMLEIAARKRSPLEGAPLNAIDQALLDQAITLIGELDSYHGRANFDDRNIEDLLSILSFKELAGGKGSRTSLEKITKAIARTIELTCRVKNRSLVSRPTLTETDPSIYRAFWATVFDVYSKNRLLPTLITFNYDLVLERSLLEQLTGTRYNPTLTERDKSFPVESIGVKYFNKRSEPVGFSIEGGNFRARDSRGTVSYKEGQKLVPLLNGREPSLNIPILKLHGSLNFSKDQKQINLEEAVEDPQILPPLFNKDTAALGSAIWSQALKELREAKNIVIVGYSLPQTDIYMQYFLKAALGPNVDLNKITVFDPSLHNGSDAGVSLRRRYEECFSHQLQRRIEFNPSTNGNNSVIKGTTEHFVYLLGQNPKSLMFY